MRAIDKTKIPAGLVVNRVWVPRSESDPRAPIAYVSERRRRIAGTVIIVLGVILGLAVLLAKGSSWIAFVALFIAWAGVAYGGGGRTGFYEVAEDGGLGEYLGWSRPELNSMYARKPGGKSRD